MNELGSSSRRRRARCLRATRSASLAVSLTLMACDVEWGGVQVAVHEPVFVRQETLAVADTARLPPLVMPSGPLLFHVRRTSRAGDATLRVVGEFADTTLLPAGPQREERAREYIAKFTADYLRPDQSYVMFRGGARVGTFYVRAPRVEGSGLCARLEAEGRIELRPRLDTLSEFLAWAPGVREGFEDYVAPEQRANMAELAQVLAQRGVNRLREDWFLGGPDDLRAVNVGSGPVALAATFMTRDSLAEGTPADSAGMAFLVADFDPARGYFPLFFEAEWYGPGSKRALRWVDAANIVGDTLSEWVAQAYGDEESWYELIGSVGGSREVIWTSRRSVCEARQAAASP
jgi:hypothetical protein